MNFNFSNLNKTSNHDLNCYTCGIEECVSGHDYGPTVRSGHMIYFILDGKGTYSVNGITYHLSKNEGFFIEPKRLIYFKADSEEPWTYLWIGFTGEKVEEYLSNTSISLEEPVFTLSENIIDLGRDIVETAKFHRNRNLILTGKLYQFLYALCEAYPNTRKTIQSQHRFILDEAVFFIHQNYGDTIKVTDIAKYVHVDRTYLYKLFLKYIGMSPQKYLLWYRMERGKELLVETSLPLKIIASSVGYTDALLFSKMFKKKVGISPSAYRNIKRNIK